jgi:Lysyl oxidase
VRAVRTALAFACAGLLLAAAEPPPGSPPKRAQIDENPCIGPDAAELLCPDLVMRQPYGLYVDRFEKPGRTLLRAGNVIDSIGDGPAELHGVRDRRRFMRARQRIYRRDGTRLGVNTGALLQLKLAHLDSYWWKFYDAARFELWRVDGEGRRTRLVRTGPKVAYCLRDLTRTRPRLPRSPRERVYPACSRKRTQRKVTLGTSIGWADIYPPTYPEQWIDVTGLRGCFAYVHIVDPENGIYELDEDNNEAQTIVRLPFRPSKRRGRCRGRDVGRFHDPTDYYP